MFLPSRRSITPRKMAAGIIGDDRVQERGGGKRRVRFERSDQAAVPDQETYKKEEQRRFEILEAHWDSRLKK